MIPNPLRKVRSSIRRHRVRSLLMGGQACAFHGAAEFGRDTAFAILAAAANLARFKRALNGRQAGRAQHPLYWLPLRQELEKLRRAR